MSRYPLLVGIVCVTSVVGAASPKTPADRSAAVSRPIEIDPLIDSLKFELPELRQRFLSFDKAAREFAVKDFAYRHYQPEFGNFLWATWSKGIGCDEPCVFRGPRDSLRDIHRIRVETIVVPTPDQAKAAGLAVEAVPANPDQWCVCWYFREATEQNVTGPDWSIVFFRWDPAKLSIDPFRPQEETKEKIVLPVYGYGVSACAVSVNSKLSVNESFLRYVRSADAMRDSCIADLAELEKRVILLIEAHKAYKTVYGAYYGGGIPPPSHEEPLNTEEEKTEVVKAKAYFAAQAQCMRDHHRDMYRALRKSFPLERCWKELIKPNSNGTR